MSFGQDDLKVNGHAIEVRINAEKLPNFSPAPVGSRSTTRPAGSASGWIPRFMTAIRIPPYYDSLIAKLIVHGRDRPEALARLNRALGELIVDGIDSTVPLFHALLQEPDIQTGDYTIHWLEDWLSRNVWADFRAAPGTKKILSEIRGFAPKPLRACGFGVKTSWTGLSSRLCRMTCIVRHVPRSAPR
jgi:acetyl/propionyl-CoA carboxylase alpha subunit